MNPRDIIEELSSLRSQLEYWARSEATALYWKDGILGFGKLE